MSTEAKRTFWSLIQNHQIIIPVIQRDYAQGRDNDKAKDIRQTFISDLINILTDNKKESLPVFADRLSKFSNSLQSYSTKARVLMPE